MIIAESLGTIDNIIDCKSMFKEGDKAELRLYVSEDLDQEDIDFLERELNTVLIAPIIQDARTVIIKFHASDPL